MTFIEYNNYKTFKMWERLMKRKIYINYILLVCETVYEQKMFVVEYTGNTRGIIPGGNEGKMSFLGKSYVSSE